MQDSKHEKRDSDNDRRSEREAVPDYLGGECATIPRPAVDEYPRAGMDGVDADAICPGKKLGAYMRRTLAP